MLRMRICLSRLMVGIGLLSILSIVSAQTPKPDSPQRKPSEAIRSVVVLNAQSLDDLRQKLQPDNKVEELIGGAGMELRVAIQHEKNKVGSAAELHDASDDVYYVLEGSAVLVLGGKLESPTEQEPGEWRSPRILDGRTIEISKGDLIIVPRGTPHQRSTGGKDFTMILFKIYADPLKPPPKPAAETRKPNP